MLPIQDQFHRLTPGGPVQSGQGSHLHGYHITHHGTVHKVGKQNPALVLGHSQQGFLTVQLNQIRFLGPFPRSVTAAPDGTGSLTQRQFFPIDSQHGRHILGLGEHSLSAETCYDYFFCHDVTILIMKNYLTTVKG